MLDQPQPTPGERARVVLADRGINLEEFADRPMIEVAQAFIRAGIPVVPGHFRPDDRRCSCGNPECPEPGEHPIHRHPIHSPWECQLLEANHITAAWKDCPRATVGFCLQLAGEKYQRRFFTDGTAIREFIDIIRIK